MKSMPPSSSSWNASQTCVLLDVHLPGGGGQAVIAGVVQKTAGHSFPSRSRCRTPPKTSSASSARSTRLRDKGDLGPGVSRRGASSRRRRTRCSRRASPDSFSTRSPSRPTIYAQAATPIDPELDLLTPRERGVLRLIARGYTYKEIASELGIAVKTVESHVSAVLRKLQLSNRYQLTFWASERRLQ